MRKLFFTLFIVIVLGAGLVLAVKRYVGNFSLPILSVQKGQEISSLDMGLLRQILGFDKPRIFLVLYLNNTELRPGGGFIGTYAVIKVDKGVPHILKVEGTEILDNFAPKNFISRPPDPIAKYLHVSRWNFRDSNWSPDFVSSTVKALELYKQERGMNADEIFGVIGITPTVIENFLKITGPVFVDGIEFNSANFTEKLEYEVEYNYEKRGIDFFNRKQILSTLTAAVISRVRSGLLTRWADYWQLINAMLKQKQIILYSTEVKLQKFVESKNWAGGIIDFTGDYLLWADANLGALKTDAVMARELNYKIYQNSQGEWLGEIAMTYNHLGKFDWRTSQYLDYARVFVPMGSRLLSVSGADETDYLADYPTDLGTENGYQWFGAFIKVYPGKEKILTFKFKLSPLVVKNIEAGVYKLLAQKQIGTVANILTLDLNFGKTLTYGNPSETAKSLGDNKYELKTDLILDREFTVKLKN